MLSVIGNLRMRVVPFLIQSPDFSNPQFFEPPDNSNQKSFPLLSQTL